MTFSMTEAYRSHQKIIQRPWSTPLQFPLPLVTPQNKINVSMESLIVLDRLFWAKILIRFFNCKGLFPSTLAEQTKKNSPNVLKSEKPNECTEKSWTETPYPVKKPTALRERGHSPQLPTRTDQIKYGIDSFSERRKTGQQEKLAYSNLCQIVMVWFFSNGKSPKGKWPDWGNCQKVTGYRWYILDQHGDNNWCLEDRQGKRSTNRNMYQPMAWTWESGGNEVASVVHVPRDTKFSSTFHFVGGAILNNWWALWGNPSATFRNTAWDNLNKK
jgi:hypothetical protein